MKLSIALICACAVHGQSVSALRWVKQFGDSGQMTAVASATDKQGNLYLVGNTSSLQLPVVAATRPQPGGSPLMRIDAESGAIQPLLSPLLTDATKFTADPGNPSVLYAGADGGLLRSTDSGATWTRIDTFPPVSQIDSIMIDPADSNILYVAANAKGLFRSGDGGVTWASLNQAIPPSANGNFYVNHAWVDAWSSTVLFASSAPGLIRSADAGTSWTVVLANDVTSSLAFDPFTPGTIYETGGGGKSEVNRSTDDGLTWTPLKGAPTGYPNQIVADPLHARTLYYGSYSGIYQSADSGDTWVFKTRQRVGAIAADPTQPVLYASLVASGVVRSTDGFTTSQPFSETASPATQIFVIGSQLFVAAAPSTDLYLVKLDASGATVYATYFGGSGADAATGLAAGADGSVYVTGSTSSFDFPVTSGAYLTTAPPASPQFGNNRSFVFKLNSDGSLAWSTYFADVRTTPVAIAVDQSGNPYLAGYTYADLPVTEGAYQTTFQSVSPCAGIISIGPCPPAPSAAFLTKFNASGSGLVFSTYMSHDTQKRELLSGVAIAVDPAGNSYIASRPPEVFLMSADGSSMLASKLQNEAGVNALALDANGDLYATGQANGILATTPGAFQTSPQPAIPPLPNSANGPDAFVLKFDSGLSQVLAATLLGGEGTDIGRSIAVDSAGNVLVGGSTTSKAFPTRAPLQAAFAEQTGFLSVFDPGLSRLQFSTYIGDSRFFNVQSVAADSNGNALLFGSTLVSGSGSCLPTPCDLRPGSAAFANRIALAAAPALHLDAVVNTASQYASPLSPSESIDVIGAGFDASAQVLLNGTPIPVQARGAGRITALVPVDIDLNGPAQVAVSSSGGNSNSVLLPTAAASPGIYSVTGTGVGQGYILNSDGTLNSPDEPAAPGSSITIFATGVGPITFDGSYAITAQPVSVFIDGFYANGIAANARQMAGLPGSVYAISVYVPDPSKLVTQNPNLANFKFPPQVPVLLVVGPVYAPNPAFYTIHSQMGLALSVK